MELIELRDQINSIDDQILSLLHKRAEISMKIGSIKADIGEEIYAPHREREILDRLITLNQGIYPEVAIEKFGPKFYLLHGHCKHRSGSHSSARLEVSGILPVYPTSDLLLR